MSRHAERSQLSADEYLLWEREQPARHEFFRGEVFAMAGGSMRHNALCSSVNAALKNCPEIETRRRVAEPPGRVGTPKNDVFSGREGASPPEMTKERICPKRIFGQILSNGLRARGCVVLTSDQRVGFRPRDRYVYADVSVVCGAVELEPGTSDVLANPTIIVEVLSSSTEQYDRGLKWDGYQKLDSLTDYVLVSQGEPRIEHFRRDASGGWTYRSARTGQRVGLSNGFELDVDALFAGMMVLPGD